MASRITPLASLAWIDRAPSKTPGMLFITEGQSAAGSITAGQPVTAAAAGAVAAYPATGGDPAEIIGRALTPSASGTVLVKIGGR